LDGFLLINKPRGPSSFRIVSRLRRILCIKKIGHAGTLDPLASGLLVIAIGNATRLIQYIPSEPKVYQFGIQFGKQTDTLDSEGCIVCQGGKIPLELQLRKVLENFVGEQMQKPPEFSALKIDGVRAYELARKGKKAPLQSRKINIYSIQLTEYNSQTAQANLEVCCSGGTYVRALARDIATSLDSCGYATFVYRKGSGIFDISSAIDIDNCDNVKKYIIPVRKVFGDYPSIEVSLDQNNLIANGRDIKISQSLLSESNMVFAYKNGMLLAVLRHKEDNIYHPSHVFFQSR